MCSIVYALVGLAVIGSAWESERMVKTNGEIAKHDSEKTLQTLLLALGPAAAARKNFAQTSSALLADRDSTPMMGDTPSFAEYMASRGASGSGAIADTLATIQGPDIYWGEKGPLQSPPKEESDFKEYDKFSLFLDACKSNGVDLNAKDITVLAPGNAAVEAYTSSNGPLTKAICEYHIIKGVVPASSLSSADLTTVQGEKITYRRQFRMDFLDGAKCNVNANPPKTSYKSDIKAGNGIIHFVSEVLTPGWSQ